MSFNGSGSFLINTAGQPVVSGTVISSTAFNALTADLATGLSTCITKDGQTTVTANIPMANYKFTGLGAGSGAADSANLSQVQSTVVKLLASVSGTDTITAVGSPTVAAYAAGQMFYFVAAGDNTGAVTINIDSLGAKAVTRDGSVALVAGDIKSGEVVVIVYDGTRFQVVSQLNSSGDARFANVSIASALNVGGVATFSAGTAAAPAITTTGDTNTGIFFPAADTIAFAEGGVEAMRIDSSANVGIGTSSPDSKLNLEGNSTGLVAIKIKNNNATGTDKYINMFAGGTNTGITAWNNSGVVESAVGANLVLSGYNGTILFQTGTGRTTQATLDTSGNLGLGVTPSASWRTDATLAVLEVKSAGSAIWNAGARNFNFSNNSYWVTGGSFQYASTGAAAWYQQTGGEHRFYNAASGTAGGTISFTQAMTLDASGNLLVGKTSSTGVGTQNIEVSNASSSTVAIKGGSNEWSMLVSSSSDSLRFYEDSTERARITSGGEFLVGQTGGSVNTVGAYITGGGQGAFCTSGDTNILVNRKASDGTLVSFRQDDNEEGTISVSGATVSYNAFAGSHWSQLQDGSKPDILRGTVMESINELCVWPGEQNERLPKSKISDTAGSKKVYGVFMAWDNDWTATNDMYVTAVGAFICRVNGSVTVQEGDLLESNGDGTARVQADDIIRSSTIGKVTSTVKTHQYDDGSYCVPTVLYCG